MQGSQGPPSPPRDEPDSSAGLPVAGLLLERELLRENGTTKHPQEEDEAPQLRQTLDPRLNTELKLSVRSLETSLRSPMEPGGEERREQRRQRLLLWAVILLCTAGALQGILVNGLINVVISSIEKRFAIKSSDSGWIANSYDIASFLCLLPVSYMGGRGVGSKPAWMGVGVLLMGLGSLLFSLPHFLTETVEQGEDGVTDALCGVARQQVCGRESDDNKYKYVFMTAQLLHGAGAAPLYTLGVTYIDENVGPSSSAFYLGIFYTMAIVGPAIGYSLGGHFLTLHTDLLQDISPDDGSWVGAWWIGFVVCGAAFLLLAVPVFRLPASFPGAPQPTAEQVCRSRVTSIVGSRGSSFRVPAVQHRRLEQDEELTAGTGPLPVGRDLVAAMVSLMTNPTFLCLCLAGASEGFLMTGLATFLPKLIQNTYRLSASQAAINVGAISVVGGGGGTLVGGLTVKKLGLKVPGLLKMTSLTQLVAIVMALGLLAGCEPALMVGKEGPGGEVVQGPVACSCECNRLDYQPVCSDGVEYYNPCYAGCQVKVRDTFSVSFANCTCVGDLNQEAKLGACDASCPLLPVFLVSLFLTMFITFLANMPTLSATLRCVDPNARSLALGIQWLVIRALGTIPGPVAMGKLFDLACTSKKEGCQGSTDHCVLYDNGWISGNVMTLVGICKGLSIIAFLVGLRLYKLPVGTELEDKDEEKDGKKEEAENKEEKEEKS